MLHPHPSCRLRGIHQRRSSSSKVDCLHWTPSRPTSRPVSSQTASKDVHVPTPHPLENAKLDGTSSGRAADAPNSQPGLEDARTSTGGLPNRTLFCQSSQNLLPRQQIPTSTAERFHHTALEDGKRGIPSLDDDAGRGGVGRPTGGLRDMVFLR